MKKFNKDDFKKNRDKLPMYQRALLAILIATAVGLAIAGNAAEFDADGVEFDRVSSLS
ncbi:hypothetical protein [Companilactobacillus zhongbaensis]|uniref:hypothetical protein n=1 Tax=Companilactobacillus zhongbaensis TaxID=2486009 RepID=UPI0013DDFF5A|nr:hypothetical protein [Companilactobacillus zhongbaensis]